MSKFSVATKKIGSFVKRNAFYFLIVLLIASVATVIALAVTYNQDVTIDTNLSVDDTPVVNPDVDTPIVNPDVDDTPSSNEPEPLTFINPTNGTISKDFCDTTVVWNSTLQQYSTHLGIDFVSSDLNVYASCDGIVKEVGTDALDGNYVVLTHGDGYETKYMSLDEHTLKVGDSLKQGQLLGQMSTSQGSESLDGNHLHFEMMLNGEYINPLSVIVLDEK